MGGRARSRNTIPRCSCGRTARDWRCNILYSASAWIRCRTTGRSGTLKASRSFSSSGTFTLTWCSLPPSADFLTLAAWLWFVVAYLIYLLRLLPRLRQRTRFGFAVVTGIFTGFVAFLLTSLVESSLGDDTLVMLIFFCVGVAHCDRAYAEYSRARSTWREKAAVALALGFWLLAS